MKVKAERALIKPSAAHDEYAHGFRKARQTRAELAKSCLRAYMLALLVLGNASPSRADDLADCVSRAVTFDGTEDLHYASVKLDVGPRVYLHAQYPSHCTSGDQSACSTRAYLVPTNVVAIGKQCGRWDYVQYIGEKRITQGWVYAYTLTPIPPPPPPPKPGKDVLQPSAPDQYHFELTRGTGKPVCEAYLQRLNQTEFYSPPYCERPESTLVPGFALLHRRYLTVARFKSLFRDARAVLTYDPLAAAPTYDPTYPGFVPGAWTYDPPVDIENSGRADNLILWTTQDRYNFQCGTPNNPDGSNTRGSLAGLVVSAGGGVIDRNATYAVFGMSDLAWFSQRDVRHFYPEFSQELGVFRYRNINYFDAFLTGSREFVGSPGHRPFDPRLQSTLAVFLYAQSRRREICEYYVSGLRNDP